MIERVAALGADYVLLRRRLRQHRRPADEPGPVRAVLPPRPAPRWCGAAKASGLRVIKHTCGRITSLLDMIVGTGIDALHPLDASAGMDMAAVKAKYGDRIAVCGGINCGEVLSDWPTERVEAEVKRRLDELMPGGGYILCRSNSIHSSVKPANYARHARGRCGGTGRTRAAGVLE